MVICYALEKTQLTNETNMEYMQRICSIKDTLSMTWKDVAELLNTNLNLRYSDSWYRKNYHNGTFTPVPEFTTASSVDNVNETSDSYDSVSEKLHKLALKKVEVTDLVTQNNAYIRRLSRENTLKEIARDYAEIMSKEKQLTVPTMFTPNTLDDAEGILLLSDWHYGMVCDNPWNLFNPTICKYRVNKLLNRVINLVHTHGIKRVHVFDLADLIAGRIHTQIRIESRFDVITQTMEVCEILAEFISELSNHCFVSFYSCLDNHSRLEPNKKESMDLESLARLVPWYLKERLGNNQFVDICSNTYGEDIITCCVAGHKIIGVHGDNDHPTTAMQRLSLMTHEHYDMLCTAHRHHMFVEEVNETLVIGNSSLMGVDSYAVKLRLTSDPSQTFIVATRENVCEALYRIVLKND